MTERCARHDGESYQADGAGGPCVHPRGSRHEGAHGRHAKQQKPDRNERVADMQHEHERLSERAISGPAQKPRRLHAPGDQQQHAATGCAGAAIHAASETAAGRDRRHVKT